MLKRSVLTIIWMISALILQTLSMILATSVLGLFWMKLDVYCALTLLIFSQNIHAYVCTTLLILEHLVAFWMPTYSEYFSLGAWIFWIFCVVFQNRTEYLEYFEFGWRIFWNKISWNNTEHFALYSGITIMPGETKIPFVPPTFSWDSPNLYSSYKLFNWLGDNAYEVYENLHWEDAAHKDVPDHVLEVFEKYFKPEQNQFHSWYTLGSIVDNSSVNMTSSTGLRKWPETVPSLMLMKLSGFSSWPTIKIPESGKNCWKPWRLKTASRMPCKLPD